MNEGTHIAIGERTVGPGNPPLLVAEVAQAHDGSLGMAHAFIDAAASAGADAVKFQTHIAEAESTLDEPFRVRFSRQDDTRYEYWRRMEFSAEQWAELSAHARDSGLIFLSTAFSPAAVDLLRKIGMPAWKIGSGELRWPGLLDAMCDGATPVLLSTGMATRAEIARSVERLRAGGTPHALMQCTSAYPTPLAQVGLNVLDELRTSFGCPVGLSDHSGSIYPGLAAMARGADLLEVHVTFHRAMFGPDVPASVTFEEFKTLSGMRDAMTVMDANPVDKDEMAHALGAMRETFGRSLAPAAPLEAGTVLTSGMLIAKKPGGGIPPEAAEAVIGRRLIHNVQPERLLRWEDFGGQDG